MTDYSNISQEGWLETNTQLSKLPWFRDFLNHWHVKLRGRPLQDSDLADIMINKGAGFAWNMGYTFSVWSVENYSNKKKYNSNAFKIALRKHRTSKHRDKENCILDKVIIRVDSKKSWTLFFVGTGGYEETHSVQFNNIEKNNFIMLSNGCVAYRSSNGKWVIYAANNLDLHEDGSWAVIDDGNTIPLETYAQSQFKWPTNTFKQSSTPAKFIVSNGTSEQKIDTFPVKRRVKTSNYKPKKRDYLAADITPVTKRVISIIN